MPELAKLRQIEEHPGMPLTSTHFAHSRQPSSSERAAQLLRFRLP
jgi:hypothetical protein